MSAAEPMEPCCDCGEDYPRRELLAGEVLCARCRSKPLRLDGKHPVPDSDRPALKSKADDIRDEEIEDLQRQVKKLRERVEELERRPVYVPMPAYPVDCPHRWPYAPPLYPRFYPRHG